MKIVKLIFFLGSILISVYSEAQFGQFWNTRTQKNPAFIALNHQHFANASHRNIWPSLSGSRQSNSVSYGVFLKKLKGGVGLYYNNEEWGGSFLSNSIKLAYNYQKQLGRRTRLSAGVGAGMIFSKRNYNIGAIDPNPPSQGRAFGLDFGTALSWRKLNVGVGVQNVAETNDVARDLNGEKMWNLCAQYTLDITRRFQFIPQFQVETDFIWHQTMVNGKFGYNKKYFLGAGLIYNNMLLFSGEVFLWKKFRFTYTYQQTINSLYLITAASHEFGVNFEIKKKPHIRTSHMGISF